jgi:Family of unknown function (DUF5990)
MADSKSSDVLIRVIVDDPPGGVAFQLQRGKQDLVPATRATPKAIVFELAVRIDRRPTGEPNFLGSFVQGSPASRFVYVNSGTLAGQADSCWTRRAKVPLTGITWDLIERARAADAMLESHVAGTGRDGGPACASVPVRGGWRVARSSRRDRSRPRL